MLWHVRQDHGAVVKSEGAKLSCPVTDCHKQYKVRGWVKKHIQSCHPELMSTASGSREQPSRANTPLPRAGRGKVFCKFECNFPGCSKSLGTEKGTRNHGYEKHNWFVASNAPLGEGRKRITTKSRLLRGSCPTKTSPASRDKSEASTEMLYPHSTVFPLVRTFPPLDHLPKSKYHTLYLSKTNNLHAS
ncbi:unnamed protein product [Hymenolepis diminuta]|uniref:C2H2-type domain-containing protein n=1 Tax=Hymenolepis diminuta TaxID=6216 RepID=A0A564ZE71_HYMDI|nr:unnamed protein product [Hymenolepis diminuta]